MEDGPPAHCSPLHEDVVICTRGMDSTDVLHVTLGEARFIPVWRRVAGRCPSLPPIPCREAAC